MNAVTEAVGRHLRGYFEESDPAAAKLTFLGADALTILRFGPDADRVVAYATLGCSAAPMQDPSDFAPDPEEGPRAELVLPVRGGLDAVLRPLAMLAAAPSIEGLILQPGALLDFNAPLWDGARFTAFMLLDSPVPDVEAAGRQVSILQPAPITPNEIALARAKGAAELQRVWQQQGVDVSDPHRTSAV
ncbi:suppressor of fused domain protein [Corynebacterium sp. 335C]